MKHRSEKHFYSNIPLIPFILCLVTFFFYYPSLHFPFQFDDLANIVKYFNIRIHSFSSIFFKNSRWISYWLNALYYQMLPASAKFYPFLYRLGNVVFHCISGFLLFYTVYFWCSGEGNRAFIKNNAYILSIFTTIIFLLHPVQTQTVSYVIQGQLEGLAGLATLMMLLSFLKKQYFLYFLFALFACGTKEITIISVLLVSLTDWFFVSQGKWKLFKEKIPLHAGIWCMQLFIYMYLLKPTYFFNIIGLKTDLPNNIGNLLTQLPGQRITPFLFFISQGKVILHYLFIFIWPFSMSVDYDWKLSEGFFSPDCYIPYGILVLFISYLFYQIFKDRTNPYVFCFLWFFISILPRSSVIPSTELLADYKTYIASIAASFFLSLCLLLLVKKCVKLFSRERFIVAGFITVLIVSLGMMTYSRNKVWSSAEIFWKDIIKKSPKKARAYNNCGVALCEKNEHKDAVWYFEKAISLDPQYADPYNNISVAYAALKKIDLAIVALRKSIQLMPYHPETYNNLATMLIQKNEFSDVESLLGTAIKLRPHYGKAYYNLGVYYMKMNQLNNAFTAYKNCCLHADYDNIIGFSAYAKISMLLDKHEEAFYACKKLIELQPESKEVLLTMLTIYDNLQKYEDAEHLCNLLLAKFPNDQMVQWHVGESLYLRNEYDRALVWYKKIQEKNPYFTPVYLKIPLCYKFTKQLKKAYEELQKFLDNDPPEPYAQQAREILKTFV